MKYIYYLFLSVLMTAGLFTACSPQEESTKNLGNVISADSIKISITEDPDSANYYHFKLLTTKCIGWFTSTDLSIDTKTTEFAQVITWAGDYTISVRVYNKAGLSEIKTFQFNVPQNNPNMYKDPFLVNLTGGLTQKSWVWDSTAAGHIGCGDPALQTPGWWAANPSDKKGLGLYDDELQFVLDKNSDFKLTSHGNIFVNAGALPVIDPTDYPTAPADDHTISYIQPAGQTWTRISNGGTDYIKFSSGTFPSYLCNADAYAGGTYQVMDLTPTRLELRWSNKSIAWYFVFKAK